MNLGPLNSWAEFRCMWRHKSVVAGFCGGGLATPKSHRIFQESAEMKPSSSYSLLEFVYFTSQWHHSLEVHPLLRKNPGSALGFCHIYATVITFEIEKRFF